VPELGVRQKTMRLSFPILSVLAASVLPSCDLGRAVLPEQATYAYVGTIHPKTPKQIDGNNYELEMTFSGGAWGENSGICFHHADAVVAGSTIRMKVFTGLCGGGAPKRYVIRIEGFSAPEYDLIYVDPDGTTHPIGKLHR
jgi:hypothetical protein